MGLMLMAEQIIKVTSNLIKANKDQVSRSILQALSRKLFLEV